MKRCLFFSIVWWVSVLAFEGPCGVQPIPPVKGVNGPAEPKPAKNEEVQEEKDFLLYDDLISLSER